MKRMIVVVAAVLFVFSIWFVNDGQAGRGMPAVKGKSQSPFATPNAFVSSFRTSTAPIFHPSCDPCPP